MKSDYSKWKITAVTTMIVEEEEKQGVVCGHTFSL